MAQAPAFDPLLGFQRDLTERVKKELNKDNPCTQALHAVRREQQAYHGAAAAIQKDCVEAATRRRYRSSDLRARRRQALDCSCAEQGRDPHAFRLQAR